MNWSKVHCAEAPSEGSSQAIRFSFCSPSPPASLTPPLPKPAVTESPAAWHHVREVPPARRECGP